MLRLKKCMKIIKTCNMYCTFLTLGLLLSVVGPSLLDLQHLIHTDMQHVSYVYTARSTGYIVGAILSGVVLDLVKYRQAVMAVCCLVAGGTMTAVPWSQNFATLISYMVVNGIFLGALETGGNVGILNLWGKDSGPLFQGLQFTFGVGGFVAPIIAAPFLRDYNADNPVTKNSSFSDTSQSFTDQNAVGLPGLDSTESVGLLSELVNGSANHVTQRHLRMSRGMQSFFYRHIIPVSNSGFSSINFTDPSGFSPTRISSTEKISMVSELSSITQRFAAQNTISLPEFTLTESAGLLSELANGSVNGMTQSHLQTGNVMPSLFYPYVIPSSVAFLTAIMLIATSVVSPTEEAVKDEDKQDNSSRTRGFMFAVVFLFFLLIFVSCAMEIGYAQMLTSYAVKGGLHLTASQGSYVTSVFWAAFTVSRLASTFLVIKVSNFALIVGDLVLVSIASLLLLLLMPSEAVLWVATVVFGTGIGSFYASSVGWVNAHIYVTNKIAAIITVGAAAGESSGPVIISYFMDMMPDVFVYVVASACLLTWAVVGGIYAFFRRFDKAAPHESRNVYTVRTSSITV